MRKWFKSKSLFVALLAITACLGPLADAKSESDFYDEVSRLNKVLSEIHRKYVEDVEADELTEAAISGIRDILDPHTAVFSPKGYDDLKVHTEGEFGGLGITIAIRDNVLTIISPLQGTPAFKMGLQAGDRIIKIEGKSTQGITTEQAVEKLRGKVGTDVTITIAREGEPEPIDYTITRGRIVLHSVPYAGMLEGDIGYIKVVQFSQKTSNDIRNAVDSLKTKGMKKLILDLRFNPGGLLSQAIEVSEMFLKKGNTIVSTKGRVQSSETISRKDGFLSDDIPLVVLLNEGSASASEIVAGAIQDWDRGVIVGKTSFGKGSVQTIFPLDNDGNALKLTTAFYYLPHGRCINKPENGIQGRQVSEVLADSAAQDSTQDTTEVFFTANGRKMYGEGGITPDVEVNPRPMSWFAQTLERQTKFFKFVVKERPGLEKQGVTINENWDIPDSLVEQFRTFLYEDSVFQEMQTGAEQALNLLDTMLLKEQELTGDTSKVLNDKELNQAISNLHQALKMDRQRKFDKNIDYVRRGLKREFLGAVIGEQASIKHNLQADLQVQEAIDILQHPKRYNEILTPDQTGKKN